MWTSWLPVVVATVRCMPSGDPAGGCVTTSLMVPCNVISWVASKAASPLRFADWAPAGRASANDRAMTSAAAFRRFVSLDNMSKSSVYFDKKEILGGALLQDRWAPVTAARPSLHGKRGFRSAERGQAGTKVISDFRGVMKRDRCTYKKNAPPPAKSA